jgi:predicted metal-dependent hydrolase
MIIFIKKHNHTVLVIESMVDNKYYIVNNYDDRQNAADILARIYKNICLLRDYLVANREKYDQYEEYIDLLDSRYKNVIIKENTENNNYTSYSVNKGEEIIFCIRSKIDNSLHDINLIMYVAIHEFAHVACPEIGHTPLFKKIFKFLLESAIKINIYRYDDYKMNEQEYCGIQINETILHN